MTEHDFQVNIVRTLRMQNIFVFAVPNAQKFLRQQTKTRQYFSIKNLYQSGFMDGVSDLIVFHKGKVFFVEIKRPAETYISPKTGKRLLKRGGVQGEEQIKFQQEIEKEGFPYILIDSWKKFEDFLSEVKNES